ncbi:Uridine phosphorylase 1 [Eumeta japonica]|uniref:Uridine phosphorylase 1 n=1 Tax=Eumeta variegata TaxID=151549 RepID=A0A4C1WF89_EUMVA|nr:Uridine phosphorylase 1 [Eumeta japonica]
MQPTADPDAVVERQVRRSAGRCCCDRLAYKNGPARQVTLSQNTDMKYQLPFFRYVQNEDGTISLQNENLRKLKCDVLYHLGMDTQSYDMPAMFGDIRYYRLRGRRVADPSHENSSYHRPPLLVELAYSPGSTCHNTTSWTIISSSPPLTRRGRILKEKMSCAADAHPSDGYGRARLCLASLILHRTDSRPRLPPTNAWTLTTELQTTFTGVLQAVTATRN